MDESARSQSRPHRSTQRFLVHCLALILAGCFSSTSLRAQDWVKTGTALGVEKVRLAVSDFKAATADTQNTALLKTFNDTLWNDLDVSGVVELVSKSFYPLQVPGQPAEVNFIAWNSPPPNAAMLAFGNLGVAGGKLTIEEYDPEPASNAEDSAHLDGVEGRNLRSGERFYLGLCVNMLGYAQ